MEEATYTFRNKHTKRYNSIQVLDVLWGSLAWEIKAEGRLELRVVAWTPTAAWAGKASVRMVSQLILECRARQKGLQW